MDDYIGNVGNDVDHNVDVVIEFLNGDSEYSPDVEKICTKYYYDLITPKNIEKLNNSIIFFKRISQHLNSDPIVLLNNVSYGVNNGVISYTIKIDPVYTEYTGLTNLEEDIKVVGGCESEKIAKEIFNEVEFIYFTARRLQPGNSALQARNGSTVGAARAGRLGPSRRR
jgi:hypothetical protein